MYGFGTNWLYYKPNRAFTGYPYGVSACDVVGGTEIHGPFATYEEAEKYIEDMKVEFDGYCDINVVKIETPLAAKPVLAPV